MVESPSVREGVGVFHGASGQGRRIYPRRGKRVVSKGLTVVDMLFSRDSPLLTPLLSGRTAAELSRPARIARTAKARRDIDEVAAQRHGQQQERVYIRPSQRVVSPASFHDRYHFYGEEDVGVPLLHAHADLVRWAVRVCLSGSPDRRPGHTADRSRRDGGAGRGGHSSRLSCRFLRATKSNLFFEPTRKSRHGLEVT